MWWVRPFSYKSLNTLCEFNVCMLLCKLHYFLLYVSIAITKLIRERWFHSYIFIGNSTINAHIKISPTWICTQIYNILVCILLYIYIYICVCVCVCVCIRPYNYIQHTHTLDFCLLFVVVLYFTRRVKCYIIARLWSELLYLSEKLTNWGG